jgi:hypothetical protein
LAFCLQISSAPGAKIITNNRLRYDFRQVFVILFYHIVKKESAGLVTKPGINISFRYRYMGDFNPGKPAYAKISFTYMF